MRKLFNHLCWGSALGLAALASCEKPKYPVVVPLVLTAPATITPNSATLQVGDTLWLTATFSDSLLDLTSGKRYRVRPQDMTLRPGIAISKLLGRGQSTVGIANTFQVVEKVGQLSMGGQLTGDFFPVYDGQFYRFKCGLIPTQPGITSISLLLTPIDGRKAYNSFVPFIQLPLDAQGREQKAILDDMYFVVNEGKANNYNLYRQYFFLDPETAGAPETGLFYGRNSRFTVEVK